MQAFNFKTVAKTTFGNNSTSKLAEVARSLGMRKPFIVSDEIILQLGLCDVALQKLKQHALETTLFSDIVADPPEKTVLQATEIALANQCDGVIGFGGGSSMDVAKLVAVLIKGEQSLADMYGVDQIHSARLPLIQIPTTAGTGSEATSVAIITTGEFTKAGVVSDVLLADHIILDPVLTLGLPPHITAATGIDAMVHAIEAFTSKRLKNPLSDMVALKALKLLSSSIHIAVEQGDNLHARSDMLLGAMLAGEAFANAPVAAVHALAYPLGGIYHIPHGLSNSLVLPHVLRFNAPNAAELYQQLAPSIIDSVESNDAFQTTEQLADHFLQLAQRLGLQTTLREMNIEETALDNLAAQAMLQQRLLVNNPREVLESDARAIYQRAF